jgi:hypothetical protein
MYIVHSAKSTNVLNQHRDSAGQSIESLSFFHLQGGGERKDKKASKQALENVSKTGLLALSRAYHY